MQSQLCLIINIYFHRLKGRNVTVNHIRGLPHANSIQNEMNDDAHPLYQDSGPSFLPPRKYFSRSDQASTTDAQPNLLGN